MLGLLLIYFIGKTFYTLAGDHNKNEWAYGILGVVSYYVGTFILGIGIALYFEFQETGSIEEIDDFLLGIMAIPGGLLFCWGVYALLKNIWRKEGVEGDNGMLDDGLLK